MTSPLTEELITFTGVYGGATFSMETERVANHKDGFYVGGLVPSVTFPAPGTPADFAYAHMVIRTATDGKGYIGTWVDKDTNIVYVDASEWYRDADTALAVGRERGELAVWEVAGNTELVC